MTVIHTATSDQPGDSVQRLLERADFVSLHCPLTAETHHLIDAEALATMRETAILDQHRPRADRRADRAPARAPARRHRRRRARRHRPRAAARRALTADARRTSSSSPTSGRRPRPPASGWLTSPSTTCWPRSTAGRCPTRWPRCPRSRSSTSARTRPGSSSPSSRTAASRAELERRSTVTRLAAGVDKGKRLQPESIERVFKTLYHYSQAIELHGAERKVAVLTSAVRDAANGEEFATAVHTRYGLKTHILTGDEEARLTFLGATSERDPDDTTPTLVDRHRRRLDRARDRDRAARPASTSRPRPGWCG